jgi:hypothetical protein
MRPNGLAGSHIVFCTPLRRRDAGLGMLYARMDRPEHARIALYAGIELHRALDMTFWLPQTETARAQMEAS